MATIQLDLTKYGIQGIGNVTVENIEETVEGKPVGDWPRNEAEQQQLLNILTSILNLNLSLLNLKKTKPLLFKI